MLSGDERKIVCDLQDNVEDCANYLMSIDKSLQELVEVLKKWKQE